MSKVHLGDKVQNIVKGVVSIGVVAEITPDGRMYTSEDGYLGRAEDAVIVEKALQKPKVGEQVTDFRALKALPTGSLVEFVSLNDNRQFFKTKIYSGDLEWIDIVKGHYTSDWLFSLGSLYLRHIGGNGGTY